MISKQKIRGMIFGLLVITMMILPCISAFGVSIAYNSQEKPLFLSPGESKDFQISLTASPGKSTTTSVELKKGSEIAKFLEGNKDYNIPAGGEVGVDMNVKIPEGVAEGTEYLVSFLLTDLTASAGGTVGVGGSSEISFKVIVKTSEKPIIEAEKSNKTILWVLIIIILLAIVLGIYFYSKKKGIQHKK